MITQQAAGPGKSLWRCWGQGGRAQDRHLRAFTCPLASLQLSPNARGLPSGGSRHTPQGPICHPFQPSQVTDEKTKATAVREGPDSQAHSFSHSDLGSSSSLGLPPPKSPAALPQEQEAVKVHPWKDSSKPHNGP